jgi:hypothetical protein
MDANTIRNVALSIVQQLEHGSEQVKGQWAMWPLAEQVNKLIDLSASILPKEFRPLLPAKFKQSARPSLAVARYVDVAIAASQLAALLAPKPLKKESA